jgi:hypothetical protein
MSPWWIGVGTGGALILVGLVFALLRLGPEELTEVGFKGAHVKTRSLATLSFVAGIGMLMLSLWKLDERPADPVAGPATTSTEAKQPLPEPLPAGVLFRDRFDGPLRDEWQVLTGSWRSAGGTLKGRSQGGFAVATLDVDLPKDYAVSFRTRFGDGRLAELMLRLVSNRYVRVYLYEIDQAVVLGSGTFIGFLGDITPGVSSPGEVQKSLGGGESLVETPFPVRRGVWYRVTASARARNYSIEVGGQEVISYQDKGRKLPTRGTIGLIVNGGSVEFDDVTVRVLGASQAAAGADG